MSTSDRKDPRAEEEARRAAEAEALANATTLPPERPPGMNKPPAAGPSAPTIPEAAGALSDTLPLRKRPSADKLGNADTAPHRAVSPEDAGEPNADTAIETRDVTKARVPPSRATYPPIHWDKATSVISSASPDDAMRDGDGSAGGMVATDHIDARLSEARAREILNARFTAAGINLQADYAYREADLIVNLDGFDPTQRIGYAYISHADADVVTAFDAAAALAFEQLAEAGKVFVLVVHDTDVPTPDALERKIDTFFIRLRAQTEKTQQS